MSKGKHLAEELARMAADPNTVVYVVDPQHAAASQPDWDTPVRKPTKAQAGYLEALADGRGVGDYARRTRQACRTHGWVEGPMAGLGLTPAGWAAIGRTPVSLEDRPYIDAEVVDRLLACAEQILDERDGTDSSFYGLDGGSTFEALLSAAYEMVPTGWDGASQHADEAMRCWVVEDWPGVIHGVKEARVAIAARMATDINDPERSNRIAARAVETLARLGIDTRPHVTTTEQVGDEWEWRCTCGEEATGYEDRGAADAAGQEHTTKES